MDKLLGVKLSELAPQLRGAIIYDMMSRFSLSLILLVLSIFFKQGVLIIASIIIIIIMWGMFFIMFLESKKQQLIVANGICANTVKISYSSLPKDSYVELKLDDGHICKIKPKKTLAAQSFTEGTSKMLIASKRSIFYDQDSDTYTCYNYYYLL